MAMHNNQAISKRTMLIIIMVSSLLPPFLLSSVNVALPAIGQEFNMNAFTLGWVTTSYLLSVAVLLIPFGKAADIYGRKKIFSWGVMTLTFSSLLCIFAESGTQLLFFRGLQGIGGSMIASTGMAMLSSVYQPGERGKAFGMVGLSSYVGMSIGPVLGGILMQNLGWRSIFEVTTALGLTIFFLVLKYIKTEWAAAPDESFDLSGALIYCAVLAALMGGFTFINTKWGWLLLVIGIGGTPLFSMWSKIKPHPVLDISLFKTNRVLVFSSIAALINYGVTIVISYLLSLYLQYIMGLSPQNAGFILMAQPLVQAFFSPWAGRLSDKYDPGKVSSWGLLLNGIGLLPLAFVNWHIPLPVISLCLVFQGLGCAFFISPNQNAVMSSVENTHYGVAYGFLATMRFVGQMVTMEIASLSLYFFIQNSSITPSVYPAFLKSLNLTFVIMIILCLTGIYATRIGRNSRNIKETINLNCDMPNEITEGF